MCQVSGLHLQFIYGIIKKFLLVDESDSLIIPQADENLRLIRPSLPEAVEACVDASGHEFDVSRQRTLLRAASYGQAFCR